MDYFDEAINHYRKAADEHLESGYENLALKFTIEAERMMAQKLIYEKLCEIAENTRRDGTWTCGI